MLRVELKELQANLDFYFRKLEEGEKIAVTENGTVIYVLNEPFERAPAVPKPTACQGSDRRVLGQPAGMWDSEDFQIQTPEEIIDLFYNSTLPEPKGK